MSGSMDEEMNLLPGYFMDLMRAMKRIYDAYAIVCSRIYIYCQSFYGR